MSEPRKAMSEKRLKSRVTRDEIIVPAKLSWKRFGIFRKKVLVATLDWSKVRITACEIEGEEETDGD